MNEQWKELKETIIELRDNDGTGTQQEVCKFLANLMDVLEKGESLINDDTVSRQAVLDCQRFIYDETSEELEVILAENVLNLPSVTQKSETVTEFADRCRECGAKYGKLLKQQPCEDAISRQAAIDAIYARYIGGKEAVDKAPASDHYAEGIDEAVCAVEDLPSVTPQQKTGRWVKVHPLQADDVGAYMCSYCKVGDWNLKGTEKFCPNCGAKMEEVEE